MKDDSQLSPFQRKRAQDAAAALCDPALIAMLADALAPAVALRGNAQDVVSDDILQPIITIGPLTIDTLAHEATLHGAPLDLTPREYALLLTMARRPGQVFTREQLLAIAWPQDVAEEVGVRTVDAHVTRLRRQFGDDATLVTTVIGSGYRLKRPT